MQKHTLVRTIFASMLDHNCFLGPCPKQVVNLDTKLALFADKVRSLRMRITIAEKLNTGMARWGGSCWASLLLA